VGDNRAISLWISVEKLNVVTAVTRHCCYWLLVTAVTVRNSSDAFNVMSVSDRVYNVILRIMRDRCVIEV